MSDRACEILDEMGVPAEEAYKVLRTNIEFCGLDKNIRTLTVTSCIAGEGKTTTVKNLGISMAMAGMKVLMVDADLRKPMLLKHANNCSYKGLSNFISGRVSFEEVINKTNIDGLYCIVSGVKPPNPAELIRSAKFGKFIEEAKEQFDIILIDTPPLGVVIDAALVASQTDGTLFVIQYNAVDYQSVQKAKEQLDRAKACILGVVLNKLDKSCYKNPYDYYSYYRQHKDTGKSLFKNLKKKYEVTWHD